MLTDSLRPPHDGGCKLLGNHGNKCTDPKLRGVSTPVGSLVRFRPPEVAAEEPGCDWLVNVSGSDAPVPIGGAPERLLPGRTGQLQECLKPVPALDPRNGTQRWARVNYSVHPFDFRSVHM